MVILVSSKYLLNRMECLWVTDKLFMAKMDEKGKFGCDGLNWKWEAEIYHMLCCIAIYTEAWYHLSAFNPTIIYDPFFIDILSHFGMDISHLSVFIFIFPFEFSLWQKNLNKNALNRRLFSSDHIARRSNKFHC